MNINELLELYIKERLPSKTTITKVESVIRIYCRDNKRNDIFIVRSEVIDWRAKVVGRASKITWNSYHRTIKSLFSVAVENKHLKFNVFKGIKLLKVSKTKYKVLSEKTIIKLITFIKKDFYYSQNALFYLTLIDVLRYTGIRRKQLIGIKWRDIDFEKRQLYLCKNYSKNGSDYFVPLNDKLLQNLLLLKNKYFSQALNNDQVFNITKIINTYKAEQMTVDHVTQIFVKLSRKLDILISSHRFRHTVATKIANNGGSIKALQNLLGHQDVKTTLGYVAINIDDIRVIQKLL